VCSSVGATARVPPLKYALAINPPAQVPALLNGFGLWNAILVALIVLSYGYPIGQFFFLRTHAPPGYSLTEEPRQ
jgi:cytochrome c oxidase subunit 1